MLSEANTLAFAGALAGAAEAVAVQPFDMIKTRHQLNHGINETIAQTMKSLYKEGGFRRFYRGMTAEVIGIIPKSSGMYATYEFVRKRLELQAGFENSSKASCIAGFISGIPESLIVTPTQVIKVRLQAKEHLGRYSGPIDCIQQTYQHGGIKAFATGLGPTLYRNCIWNTVYFGTMHWLKKQLPEPSSKLADSAQTLISGFAGATFATCFNAPFDVVKSRFQCEVTVPGVPKKYRTTFQSLLLIYKEEGLAACYKGFKPKAIRMGLGGAVAMTSFDGVLYLLG